MQCSVQILLLGTLAVVMVASAPLTNQEKLVNVDQAGEAVDRAKRADEEIVFGNQQNKARVVAKKSDLSNILPASAPQGELDQGSEVIVHKEMPVNEDLAARAEAAVGTVSENNEKMKEAVEEAIQSVTEAEKSEAEFNDQESVNKIDVEEKGVKQSAEEEKEEIEQGTGEVSDLAEEKVQEEDEDEDLKDLQRAADEGGSDSGDNNESSPEGKEDSEDVVKFLQESSTDSNNDLDHDRERSYYENRIHNYLMSLTNRRGFSSIRPFLSRFRRSLRSPRKHFTSRNSKSKRTRRIKRDLLDDSYYGPYDLHVDPYSPEDTNDALISSPDQYTPLSDEEAEHLYKELVSYLANSYEPEQEEAALEETPLDSYLNGYEDTRDEPYIPYDIYNEDNLPLAPNPYVENYPYVPVDFDSYQNYAKRGMIDYYPQEEEKRYFFPFSKEPETHWGAFVPEKRDYGEAIQRLQRLAMALSDNPGPYYREILEEYRRK